MFININFSFSFLSSKASKELLIINIISGGLKTYNIKLDIIIQKNPTLIGYKNEYSQVLINIILNFRT